MLTLTPGAVSGPGVTPCTADAAQVTQIRPRGLPAQGGGPSPCQHRPREPSALPRGPPADGGHHGASRARVSLKNDRTQYMSGKETPWVPRPQVCHLSTRGSEAVPLTRPRGTSGVSVFYRIPACLGTGTEPLVAGSSQAVLTRLLSPAQLLQGCGAPCARSCWPSSWHLPAGPLARGRGWREGDPESAEPQWGAAEGQQREPAPAVRRLPPEENAVTTEWATDGEEEDYLDLGQIFRGGQRRLQRRRWAADPPRVPGGAQRAFQLFPGKSACSAQPPQASADSAELYRALAAPGWLRPTASSWRRGRVGALAMLLPGPGGRHPRRCTRPCASPSLSTPAPPTSWAPSTACSELTHRLFRRDFGTLRSVR